MAWPSAHVAMMCKACAGFSMVSSRWPMRPTQKALEQQIRISGSLSRFFAHARPQITQALSHTCSLGIPGAWRFAANPRLRDKTFPPRRASHRGEWEGRFKPFHMGYRLTWITFDFCRFRRS